VGAASEDEQKAVYADYQGVNQTPGVTPSDLWLESTETATIDAAIELASRIPAARMGGAIEVPPVKE